MSCSEPDLDVIGLLLLAACAIGIVLSLFAIDAVLKDKTK